MLLSVVGWITVIHLSGLSLSLIYANYNVFKIMWLELYQTLVYTPVQLLFLRNCIGCLLNIDQYLKQPHLFLHTAFPKYFIPYFSSYSSLNITRCSQDIGNFPFLPKFHPCTQKSAKPVCGMLFLVRLCISLYCLFQKEAESLSISSSGCFLRLEPFLSLDTDIV